MTIPLLNHLSEEYLQRIRNLPLDENDVIIASFPKSGTTLLQEIVSLIRHGDDDIPVLQRVPLLDILHVNPWQHFDKLTGHKAVATHVPYDYLPKVAHEMTTKVIYIMRNPKDTFVSLFHFSRMNKHIGFKGTWDEFFVSMLNGTHNVHRYGTIFDHTRAYWEKRHLNNIMILQYEDVTRYKHEAIRKIAEFIRDDISEEMVKKIAEQSSFDAMKKNPATNNKSFEFMDQTVSEFIRKGTVGDWKNYFTPEQCCQLDEMMKEKLGDCGLEFIFE